MGQQRAAAQHIAAGRRGLRCPSPCPGTASAVCWGAAVSVGGFNAVPQAGWWDFVQKIVMKLAKIND